MRKLTLKNPPKFVDILFAYECCMRKGNCFLIGEKGCPMPKNCRDQNIGINQDAHIYTWVRRTSFTNAMTSASESSAPSSAISRCSICIA